MASEPPDPLSRTIYDELHTLAARMLVDQRRDHTLQPTALVHEAYFRLRRLDADVWGERKRFFAVAGKAMRSVLVDHARRRAAAKRGGGATGIASDLVDGNSLADPVDVLDLEQALIELEAIDPGLVRVVELLFFAGLTAKEAAGILEVSDRTVERDWRTARTWLKARIRPSPEP